jgi:poly-beta-1,6-N-acetyl-D-glucosamine synthase
MKPEYAIILPYIIYWIIMQLLARAWGRTSDFKTTVASKAKVSLVIAIRNESENLQALLKSIEGQLIEEPQLEVILVDDHSTDDGLTQLKNFAEVSRFKVKVLSLDQSLGKKAALRKGIDAAKNELLLFTDGDCTFEPHWVSSYLSAHESGAKFISAPVMFKAETNLWQRLMQLEFLGLIASGGASIKLRWNLMANGANMGVNRQTYLEVRDELGGQNKASGDDVYLLSIIGNRYPKSTVFIKSKNALVTTKYEKSIRKFGTQRLRWSSKGLTYLDARSRLIAFDIFIVNIMLLILLFFTSNPVLSEVFFVAFFIKVFADLKFFATVLPFFNKGLLLLFVLPVQVIHIPYVVFTGLLGSFVKYRWKGRKTK